MPRTGTRHHDVDWRETFLKDIAAEPSDSRGGIIMLTTKRTRFAHWSKTMRETLRGSN